MPVTPIAVRHCHLMLDYLNFFLYHIHTIKMRYAIFSDVHSNLEALEKILLFYRGQGVNSYVHCGDIVGYGPNPNECIAAIKGLPGLRLVAGNHDVAACGLKPLTWFNEYAQETLGWTMKKLTEKNRAYLAGISESITDNNWTAVHGSPRDPTEEYMFKRKSFIENLGYFNTQICFVGHTHAPLVFTSDESGSFSTIEPVTENQKIKIFPQYKYIINVGSAGQPRDGNPKACCVIYDTVSQEVEFFRHVYNFPETQNKMYELRLPSFLIERLTWGR